VFIASRPQCEILKKSSNLFLSPGISVIPAVRLILVVLLVSNHISIGFSSSHALQNQLDLHHNSIALLGSKQQSHYLQSIVTCPSHPPGNTKQLGAVTHLTLVKTLRIEAFG
jgi:hypothetical protein